MTNYSNLQYQCFTNHYQSDPLLQKTSLSMIANRLVASILPTINVQMALGNLSTAADGLPLVPTSNDIRGASSHCTSYEGMRVKRTFKEMNQKHNSFC